MDINKVFNNNKDWVKEKLQEDQDYFENLAKGQSPELLYIGCSDSRVSAEQFMGLNPGEVFVHRNVANVFSNLDVSAASVLNYAVAHLKVNHIVVCGHYYCGGVKAAMDSQDLGILNPWLRNIRDIFRIHKDELNAIEDEEARYKRLVELNVIEQCINVLKTEEVQLARKTRGLQVHAWVFDIKSGKLIDLEIDVQKSLEGLTEIYRVE